MPSVAILGGSVIGSAAALLLARAGWAVTVIDPELDTLLQSDPQRTVPRPGAPHAVQAHGFMARTHVELATRLPDVLDALLAAGAPEVQLAEMIPPHLYDGGRGQDEELRCLRVRRVTLDRVFAAAVAREPGVHRMAVKAVGLATADGRSPLRVRGVVLADGWTVEADVVLDAGGRRSPVSGWLAELGAPPTEWTDPCVARYYSREFRIRDGATPPLNRGFAEVHDFPSLTQLLFLGDNRTAMLAQSVHDEDPLLKLLRHPDAFDAVAARNEAFSAWWAALEPISEVYALGAFDNRMRSLVAGGSPQVLGLFQVGDALAMTNPTRGRGISMGLAALGRLHDLLVVEGLTGADALLAYDEWCERVLAVYYRETAATDAAYSRRLRAGLLGKSVPGNAPTVEVPHGNPVTADEISRAAASDPDLFRLLLRATMLLDDDRTIASPAVSHRVRLVLEGLPDAPPPPPEPSDGLHDRDTLTDLLAPYA